MPDDPLTDLSIRSVQNRQSFLFGPTYLQLIQDDLNVVKPFTILKRPRPAGKGKASMPGMDAGGVEFELEKNWVLAHAAGMRLIRDAEIAKKLSDEAEWAAGGGIECGCCFGDYLPVSHPFPVPLQVMKAKFEDKWVTRLVAHWT